MSLEKDIKSLVESLGVDLYDTSVVNENDETIFRVSVISNEIEDGKRKGISLDTCVELTHLISPLLDVNSPVSGEYRLEVGSPGIERKLMNIDHFKKSIGEKVNLQVRELGKVKGDLQKVENNIVFVKQDEKTLEINFQDITKAKTYFEW